MREGEQITGGESFTACPLWLPLSHSDEGGGWGVGVSDDPVVFERERCYARRDRRHRVPHYAVPCGLSPSCRVLCAEPRHPRRRAQAERARGFRLRAIIPVAGTTERLSGTPRRRVACGRSTRRTPKKVYLSQNQRHGVGLRPCEHEWHRREPAHRHNRYHHARCGDAQATFSAAKRKRAATRIYSAPPPAFPA